MSSAKRFILLLIVFSRFHVIRIHFYTLSQVSWRHSNTPVFFAESMQNQLLYCIVSHLAYPFIRYFEGSSESPFPGQKSPKILSPVHHGGMSSTKKDTPKQNMQTDKMKNQIFFPRHIPEEQH